jgi:tetratricopeptide (TPR) repeat protein
VLARGGAVVLWLLVACGAPATADAPGRKGCSVAAFEIQPERTVEACTSALDAGGLSARDRAETLKIRARSLHAIGRLDDAIRDYDAALAIAPDDPELHLRRGWTAYDRQDFALVRREAEEALRLRPGYANAYDLIGAMLAHEKVRKFDAARAAYDEAIRRDPSSPDFRYHMLQLLANWMSPQEGLEAADALLRLPDSTISRPDLVDYYGKKTSLRTAAALERARLLVLLGRREEAAKTYDRAIDVDPGALTYAWRAAFVMGLTSVDEPMDEIQADIDRSIAADGNYWFSRGLAGRVQFYGGNYQAAAVEFARAIELHPISGTMRWWHAMALRKLGKQEEAEGEAVTSFRVDPGFMSEKEPDLRRYGYLLKSSTRVDPAAAFADAARACMLDERCH